MIPMCVTFPVDELYLNIVDKGAVSRIGVNNGVVVDEIAGDPKSLVPTGSVRILGNMVNIPLILAAGKTYEVPVEVAPLPFLPEGVAQVRDVVVKSRNWHRASPTHYPLRYRAVTEQDLYSFGLTYRFMTEKLGVEPHKFDKEDVDLVIDRGYIDNAFEQHVMSDTFACEHVADFCAVMMDPRLHMGPGGKFNYSDVPLMLGFGSFELACQLTRKFIELHGADPLPSDGAAMKQLFQKVTGRMEPMVGRPTQLLGARVLHNILTTPMDNLGVSLKSTGTRLARDAEVVRQRLHSLINTWLGRLYTSMWVPDEYSPELFEDKGMEGAD